MKNRRSFLLAIISFFSATVSFAANADLSIPAHSHDPVQPQPNSYITYSFTIHNNSQTDDAGNVSVTVASTGSQFFDSGNPYFFSNNGDGTFTATVGTVAARADAAFTVKFFAQTGAVSVTATVSSPDDPDTSNNSATESASASMPTADLQLISVTASPATAVVGDIRHYHGVLKNNGPDTATSVGIGIQPDSSGNSDTYETFLAASPSPSPAEADQNGLRSIPLGDIPANGSVTFDVYYTAEQPGFFQRNFYTITSGGQTDPNVNDNYKTVFSTINGSGAPASTLFVNGGPAPTTLTPDAPIVFESYRNTGAIGVHVQYSLDGGTSWTNLNDGSAGLMVYNDHDSRYVLATESYPVGNNIYFRSDAVFSDQSEQASEAVGPFNITSSETHLPPTTFKIEGVNYPFNVNYPSYPLNFEAATSAQANGSTVQLQYSVTPEIEGSWSAVDNGNNGYLTSEGGNSYLLKTNQYPTGTGIYFRAVTSATGYVESISNFVGPFTLPGDPGALPMTLTVNGNQAAFPNAADTVLRFSTIQAGTSAGLNVRIQYNTGDPNNEPGWTDLADNNSGFMIFDVSAGGSRFVLDTTSYPLASSVYFRAVAAAHGYNDQISNYVGPFDLTTTTNHLQAPTLFVKRNTTVADFEFRVGDSDTTPGLSIRVQGTTTPAIESSWQDLPDGHSGQVAPRSVAGQFYLLANQLPAARKAYFRAVASASGYVDGISSGRGVFTIIPHTPPVVALTPPTGMDGSGDGSSPTSRIIVPAGVLELHASASTAGSITQLGLQVDGSARYSVSDGSRSIQYTISSIDLGDHTLEAFAIDDFGARSRVPTTIFIRVVPATASAIRSEFSKSGQKSAAAQAASNVFTLVSDNAIWSDPTAWRTSQGQQGVPGANDFAIVPHNLSVTISGDPVTVKSLSLSGVLIGNGFDFTVTSILTLADQSSVVSAHLIIASGAEADLINTTAILLGNTTVDNYGKWIMHGSGSVVQLAGFHGSGMTNFSPPLMPPSNPGFDVDQSSRLVRAQSQTFSGLITGANPDRLLNQSQIGLIGGGVISNDGGTVISHDGGGVISNDGGTVISNDGGTLISQDGNGLIGQDGNGLISQDGNGLIGQDGNGLIGQDGNGLIGEHGTGLTEGLSTRAKAHLNEEAPADITISGGELNLNAVTLIGSVEMTGGILSGTGLIRGNLTNDGGYIMPGHSPGTIAVTGDFMQRDNGTIVLENGGPLSGQFDELQISGNAQLGGKLELKNINGYMPLSTNSFSPISYNTVSGSFVSVSGNAGVTAGPKGLVFTDDITQPAPKAGQPLNISTRLTVQGGDNALIGGFIITGTTPKKVIIRAIGPSLPVTGALADPTLELHEADGTVIANDNWRDTQESDVIATTIPPSNDLESAIVATLPPGAHTAIVRGTGDGTGIGLVEVYDLDSTGAAQLANISTRGNVLTDDNVMIGGFIVGGSEPAKVLVRAIGPSLANSGVQGALSDPVLEIHDSNGNVITNDDWRETQESEITATTIPPTDNRESAIVATLVPGAYTAIVRGKDGETGVAVVEAYNLQ